MAEYRYSGLKLHLDDDPERVDGLVAAVSARLGLDNSLISGFRVVRRALDARSKPDIRVIYTVEFDGPDGLTEQDGLVRYALDESQGSPQGTPRRCAHGQRRLVTGPVVVGSGPAGLFCALTLARHGYAPLVVEQGDEVSERSRRVGEFWAGGPLDESSNVQFGEGGAGTFSDGKLTTRIRDSRIRTVMDELISCGAPTCIAYEAKPHIGTDVLAKVIPRLRQAICRLGGSFRFRTKLVDLYHDGGRVNAISLESDGTSYEMSVGALVLAPGNSARSLFAMLARRGVAMQPKAFSVGARVEHLQSDIDKAQYGFAAGHPRLGPADYQLSLTDEETGRATYTFCMCPGGSVVAAASESGGVVTNGMSTSTRNSGIANAALVVSINPDDIPGDDVLRGVEFQRSIERRAFSAGGGNFRAPVQSVASFLGQETCTSASASLKPTYRPGITEADLHAVLPSEVCCHMERALRAFDRKVKGFATGPAMLTGVETRTSCPVRILRNDSMESIGIEGLFPSGEGAGYAGGIMSAAVDGIRVAEALIAIYAKPS